MNRHPSVPARRPRPARTGVALIAAIVTALLIGGCDGSGGQAGPSTSATGGSSSALSTSSGPAVPCPAVPAPTEASPYATLPCITSTAFGAAATAIGMTFSSDKHGPAQGIYLLFYNSLFNHFDQGVLARHLDNTAVAQLSCAGNTRSSPQVLALCTDVATGPRPHIEEVRAWVKTSMDKILADNKAKFTMTSDGLSFTICAESGNPPHDPTFPEAGNVALFVDPTSGRKYEDDC